jgi:hypothetical protein
MAFEPVPDETGAAPRRFRWLPLLLVVGVALAVAAWVFFSRHAHALDSVVATSGRLTLAEDKGDDLKVVHRQDEPEVWFRVDLEEVPLDAELDLRCEWVAPDGRVMRRNRYTTRRIDRAVWPTHARCRIRKDFPTGTWTVRLLLDAKYFRPERLLIEKSFEVSANKK